MKKRYSLYALVPVFALAIAGAGIASAHGWFGGGLNATPEEVAQHQTQMFQHKAELLGISVDEMKQAWAEGKTFSQIASENGISEEELQTRMKAAHEAKMKEHLQALVDQGVLTQAQADSRAKFMQEHMQIKGMGHGFRMMKGF